VQRIYAKPPILLVGEAWGDYESRLGLGFVGPSGGALLRMLDDAGIISLHPGDSRCISMFYETHDPKYLDRVWKAHTHEVVRTNVFNLHPSDNDLETLCGPKAVALPGYPAISGSKYLSPTFEPELDRLASEVLALNPNLIICLGNTPLWALGGRTGIKKWRGTTFESTHTVAGYKCLCTYHPAAVLRGWDLRPIVIADLMKAHNQSAFPDIRRPRREIWIEPGLPDVVSFISNHIRKDRPLSVDIETSGTRVTCIGLGYSEIAIVIPFDDERTKNGSYWATSGLECDIWSLVAGVLGNPQVPKLFQNGLYDIAFLWRSVRVKVLGAEHDTMLLHHALQPEMIKDLGFLGSVYADEGAWKHMRRRTKTIKRDQ
jgi:uracil-DNA glycosylase